MFHIVYYFALFQTYFGVSLLKYLRCKLSVKHNDCWCPFGTCALSPATQTGHSLTVTGIEEVPMEIVYGMCQEQPDPTAGHEEADPIIFQHATSRCLQGERELYVTTQTFLSSSISMSLANVRMPCIWVLLLRIVPLWICDQCQRCTVT